MNEPKVHHLKCQSDWFDRVVAGTKTFEVRFNDRGFQKGDRIQLEEVDDKRTYTGESWSGYIGDVLSGTQLTGNYVVFSLLTFDPFAREDGS